jgi:thiosulfate/3-mercaptopyruvate sulfurtransferase
MKNNQTMDRRSEYLVQTDQLENDLDSPNLRVFDCAVEALMNPDAKAKLPFLYRSGRARFEDGHIPGAGFLDLIADLSDPSAALPFTAPTGAGFADAMGASGVGAGDRVVLYSTTEPIWAARVWWLLRAFGFDNAAVLDGGWDKWVTEGRPVSTDPNAYPSRNFDARQRHDAFVAKDTVLAAIDNPAACTINALPTPVFAGTGGPVFGRPGRVAGSTSIPFTSLHDPDTGTYLPNEQLRATFEAGGVADAERIITYCGSGVAATNDALALTILGYDNVAVYDASMSEWGPDSSLPTEHDR